MIEKNPTLFVDMPKLHQKEIIRLDPDEVAILLDYIENGNIKNSVNYPACDMGVCAATARVTICHKNVSNMIGKFTSVLGDAGINIAKMASESRGEYAYTMLDVDAAVSADVAGKLEAIEGVLKVRVL